MKWGESSSTTLVQVQYLVWRLKELKLLEVNSKEVYCSHYFEVVGLLISSHVPATPKYHMTRVLVINTVVRLMRSSLLT